MLAFIEDGVTYHIFATKNEVTVYAMSKTFTVSAKSGTFK